MREHMEKLKQIWGYIAAGVLGLLGLFLYAFSRRGDQIASLHAEIDLASTQKQADVLESKINLLKADKTNIEQHNKELDKALVKVQDKRVEIAETAKNLKDPQAIAKYWENN